MNSELLDSLQDIKDRIKKHEGYSNCVYEDTLGKRTVGYGHLCVEDHWQNNIIYSLEELEEVFEDDFEKAFTQAKQITKGLDLPVTAMGVIIEMIFQLGIGGVSKFKKMWAALEVKDFAEASFQMRESKWGREQTPGRCEELAAIMKTCGG